MANTKISDLTSLSGAGAANEDLLPIVDVSANTTKKITRQEFLTYIDTLSFDTVNTSANPTEGQLTWDTGEKTLSLGLNGGDVVLQIGQELYCRVTNNTGTTIQNGTVVRYDSGVGASGQIRVAPALANGVYRSGWILGVATEDIPNGSVGLVTHFGKVRGINTSSFAAGDVVYVSPTVAGGLTNVQPDPPNNIVSVGVVVSSSHNGTLLVRPRVHDIWQSPPDTPTSTGIAGDNAFDGNYFYVCVAANTWKRVAWDVWT